MLPDLNAWTSTSISPTSRRPITHTIIGVIYSKVITCSVVEYLGYFDTFLLFCFFQTVYLQLQGELG